MSEEKPFDLIIILGATASGKTSLAAHVASRINGEIISADSRQVYKHMNLGTGKDYEDYIINSKKIPYHLIDMHEPGYRYNVYEFQQDFIEVYHKIKTKNNMPILCGGSGMYIEAVTKGYKLISVPVNNMLRKSLQDKSLEELEKILKGYKKLHNKTDTDTIKRAIRAIEIEEYYLSNQEKESGLPQLKSVYIGIKYERNNRRRRITERLEKRLQKGMIDEVQHLLNNGLTPDKLIYYGLEYKFITLYLTGQLSYNEMVQKLNVAIHQFAKRQMTWFRKMEREGIYIHWIKGELSLNDKIDQALYYLESIK